MKIPQIPNISAENVNECEQLFGNTWHASMEGRRHMSRAVSTVHRQTCVRIMRTNVCVWRTRVSIKNSPRLFTGVNGLFYFVYTSR